MPDNSEWLSAAEALALVRTHSGGRNSAIRSIATHAHSGLLTARAALFARTVRGKALPIEQADDYLPKEFWWAEGGARLRANWATGYFETYAGKLMGERWQAFHVEFDRAAIQQWLLPASATTANAATAPLTGRPNQRDEAIAIHVERCASKIALTNHSAEAREIHRILAKRHQANKEWKFAVPSIMRALSDHRKSATKQG